MTDPPNELLCAIVVPLHPAGHRRLSQVNHRLSSFIFDYERPPTTSLTALPNKLILNIVGYVSIRDARLFARTSWRFYSLIMDDILRRKKHHRASSALFELDYHAPIIDYRGTVAPSCRGQACRGYSVSRRCKGLRLGLVATLKEHSPRDNKIVFDSELGF